MHLLWHTFSSPGKLQAEDHLDDSQQDLPWEIKEYDGNSR
jgi:hypothetical protein